MYPNSSGRNLLYQPTPSQGQTATPNAKAAHLTPQNYQEKILTVSNNKERSKFESHSTGNVLFSNRLIGTNPANGRRTYMKPADVQVQGTYDGNMIMKGSHHSTKGKTTTMPGIQITSKNYESTLTGHHQISEPKIKKFVSPNSKFTTTYSNNPLPQTNNNTTTTSNSRTPMRPANLQTQQLQNIISRSYLNNNQTNQYITSPSNQLNQGDRIVIKSDKKRVRKSNYDGLGVKQSGVYTSRTQGENAITSINSGSIQANLGVTQQEPRRENSVRKVSTRRVETSGLSNGETSTYRTTQGSEVTTYQMANIIQGNQAQVIQQYSKNSSSRVSIGAQKLNTENLNTLIQKFTPMKGNLRKQSRPSGNTSRGNLQFYNQGNQVGDLNQIPQQQQPRRKWTNPSTGSDSPQKENLMPERESGYENRSEKTRASRAEVGEIVMNYDPNVKPVKDPRDDRIRELEDQVEELKKIIDITNKDKNLALKFNQLLLERLDEYDETPPSSSARE